MRTEILRLEDITKYVGGTKVLDHARINVCAGEIICIAGLNGSGKTTLTQIMAGLQTADAGEIYYRGRDYGRDIRFVTKNRDIVYLNQDMELIDTMSVWENLYAIGGRTRKPIFLNEKALETQSRAILEKLRMQIDPNRIVRSLSRVEQDMVRIAKAVAGNAVVIILDSFHGAFSGTERQQIRDVLRILREMDIAVVYAYNRMDEIFEIADRVIVLKEGRVIRSLFHDHYSEKEVVRTLLGHDLQRNVGKTEIPIGREIMRVEALSCKGLFSNIGFTLNASEVVGFAIEEDETRDAFGKALSGNGRARGSIWVDGCFIKANSMYSAIRNGIVLITEQAYRNALFRDLDLAHNVTFQSSRKLTNRLGLIKSATERYLVGYALSRTGDSYTGREQVDEIGYLARFKLLLQKWLLTKPKVMVLINPTRGFDMFARNELYSVFDEISRSGIAIVLISSSFTELIKLSDRVFLVKEGRVNGEISRREILQMKDMKEKVLWTLVSR